MEVTVPDTPKAVLVAGFMGSLLSLSFVEPDMCRKQRIVAMISGVAMAAYVTPLIAHMFNEEPYQNAIAFLIGLFGMSITASIFRAIKSSDLWGLIKRKYGKAEEDGQ